MSRDQPNSREKMHDFTAEFLKRVKFHGKFTERVSKIHGPHRRYFEVLRYCKRRNFRTTNIYYTKSRLETVNVNYLVLKCDMWQTAISVQKLLITLWNCHKLH